MAGVKTDVNPIVLVTVVASNIDNNDATGMVTIPIVDSVAVPTSIEGVIIIKGSGTTNGEPDTGAVKVTVVIAITVLAVITVPAGIITGTPATVIVSGEVRVMVAAGVAMGTLTPSIVTAVISPVLLIVTVTGTGTLKPPNAVAATVFTAVIPELITGTERTKLSDLNPFSAGTPSSGVIVKAI